MLGGTTEKTAISQGLRVDTATSIDSMFAKLDLDRTDIAITTDIVGKTIIDEKFPQKATEFTCYDKKAFIASFFSIIVNLEDKQAKELLGKINNGILTLYKSGKYINLLEKYYGKDKVPTESKQIIEDYINKTKK